MVSRGRPPLRANSCEFAGGREASNGFERGFVLHFWRIAMNRKLTFRAAVAMAAMLCASLVLVSEANAGLFHRHGGGGSNGGCGSSGGCGGCGSCSSESSCGCAKEEPSCGCA